MVEKLANKTLRVVTTTVTSFGDHLAPPQYYKIMIINFLSEFALCHGKGVWPRGKPRKEIIEGENTIKFYIRLANHHW